MTLLLTGLQARQIHQVSQKSTQRGHGSLQNL